MEYPCISNNEIFQLLDPSETTVFPNLQVLKLLEWQDTDFLALARILLPRWWKGSLRSVSERNTIARLAVATLRLWIPDDDIFTQLQHLTVDGMEIFFKIKNCDLGRLKFPRLSLSDVTEISTLHS